MITGFSGRLHIGGLVRRQWRTGEKRQHPHDAVERCANFMTHQTEEIFAGFQTLFWGEPLFRIMTC